MRRKDDFTGLAAGALGFRHDGGELGAVLLLGGPGNVYGIKRLFCVKDSNARIEEIMKRALTSEG